MTLSLFSICNHKNKQQTIYLYIHIYNTLVCIHQMNRVNSHNDYVMMTAP